MKNFTIAYKYVLFGTFTTIVFGIILLALVDNQITKQYKNRILPNIYLNNLPVGKLTAEEIMSRTKQETDNLKKINFTLSYTPSFVATISGTMLNFSFDEKNLINTLMIIGRENNVLDRFISRFKLFILHESRHLTILPSFTLKPIIHNLENIRIRYQKEPKDALFTFDGYKVTAFAQEEYGLEIHVQQALSEIYQKVEKAIINRSYTPIQINITDSLIPPAISLSEANSFGIRELIGSGSSDFSGSMENRIFNIEHSSSKFNGIIIKTGEEFSFNKIVGDISALTGYKQAYVIKNGKTVLGDGGGVCQVSSTFFRAALNSGLKITKRTPHAYRVHYYEQNSSPGMDATVFAPSVDFKFINNTENAILIQTLVERNLNRLTIFFYGTKDNRVVTISPVTIWDISAPPEPLYQDGPTLPNGVVKQVDWAAWGAKTKFTYEVKKNGVILQHEEFYSEYRPWQAVYLRGTM